MAVTRDDLVGQYIGHTAPKTKEVLKKAMGGVLFIDEAYYLYRPENERDYGQEAIEILLQVMENQRDDLVVILAGYKDRMETFFQSNPGMSSRIAHHLDFPDYTQDELASIADRMLEGMSYRFEGGARETFGDYLSRRITQPQATESNRRQTMSPIPFDAILFDCDGVLVDSERITHVVLTQMLGELGWTLTVDEAMGIFVGHLVSPDAMGPVMGGVTALLAILGGAWGPIAGGFMLSVGKWLPSYWLVQAGATAYQGGSWPIQGWICVGVWSAVLIRLAATVYRRDTKRV